MLTTFRQRKTKVLSIKYIVFLTHAVTIVLHRENNDDLSTNNMLHVKKREQALIHQRGIPEKCWTPL